MRNTLQWAALLFAAILISSPVRAQVSGELGIGLALGDFQGELGDNIDRLGVGLTVNGGVSPSNSPFLIGADLGFMIYGSERRNEPFSTTIPDVRVDVVTTNNIATGHLLLRVRPPQGVVRPYAEGLFGFKYFFTQTRIENEGFGGEEPIATSTNFDDATISYGVGGGVDFRVYEGQEDKPSVGIHLGVRYLLGGEASYLKEGSIRRQGTDVTFDVLRSETDLLATDFGITLTF